MPVGALLALFLLAPPDEEAAAEEEAAPLPDRRFLLVLDVLETDDVPL